MKVLKGKLTFFLVFFVILSGNIFGGVEVKPLSANMGFSNQILRSGLSLTKKILDYLIGYYHQRYSMAILELDFENEHSPQGAIREDEYKKELEKLKFFFNEKNDYINKLLQQINQRKRDVEKGIKIKSEGILCFLITTLSNILNDLPGFDLSDNGEILSQYSFNVICSSSRDLVVNYEKSCEVIDLLFLLNKTFLIRQLPISEQIVLAKSYQKVFFDDKFFQRGITII